MTCPARKTARLISNLPGNKAYLYWWDYEVAELKLADPYLGV